MNESRPIVFLCDGLIGGATQAARRLYHSLVEKDENAEFWYYGPPVNIPDYGTFVGLDPNPKRPFFERILKNFSPEMANRIRHKRHTKALLQAVRKRKPRLIQLYNLHGCGLNHESLLELPKELPLVWSAQDCWAVYKYPGEWYDEPLAEICKLETSEIKFEEAAQRRDRFFKERCDVVITGQTEWITHFAQKHVPSEVSVRYIPMGFRLKDYHLVSKEAAREELGLDSSNFYIGFAIYSYNRRKGADILFSALEQIKDPNIKLLYWGGKMEFPESIQDKVISFGFIPEEKRRHVLYSACDYFICPSRSDVGPQSVIESMACQTAVIGGDQGGVPEPIKGSKAGAIFPINHPEILAELIEEKKNLGQSIEEGSRARQYVEKVHDNQEVDVYLNLYKELCL